MENWDARLQSYWACFFRVVIGGYLDISINFCIFVLLS